MGAEVVSLKNMVIQEESVHLGLRETFEKLKEMVDAYIPYTVRNVYIYSPRIAKIWRGSLDIVMKKSVKVPFFYAPSLVSTYTFEIYKKPIGLKGIHFFVSGGMFREVWFDWVNKRWYNTWNHVVPEWGIYLLVSKPLMEEEWWRSSSIATSHKEIADFLAEILATSAEIEETDQFKTLRRKPRDLLSDNRTERVLLRIWGPEKYVRLLYIKFDFKKMELEIDFENYGKGWVTYIDDRVYVSSHGTSNERVLRYLERIDVPRLVNDTVKKTVREFLDSYIKTLVTMKILNL